VGFITGVPEPQGVLCVPGFDKIFAASAQGKIYVFNGKTRRLEKSIDFGCKIHMVLVFNTQTAGEEADGPRWPLPGARDLDLLTHHLRAIRVGSSPRTRWQLYSRAASSPP
jgi:hypothetical protein